MCAERREQTRRQGPVSDAAKGPGKRWHLRQTTRPPERGPSSSQWARRRHFSFVMVIRAAQRLAGQETPFRTLSLSSAGVAPRTRRADLHMPTTMRARLNKTPPTYPPTRLMPQVTCTCPTCTLTPTAQLPPKTTPESSVQHRPH
ncbi:hypothetical protein AAFF_G00080510 [Aldrovandia affinis]|uniref:Uncharacterized protein n=1 Tax=Aldrovandia affinis TaxID=143900 RepID=A0AAD7T331_9TELE|nr:hypothetical protein AAFF_G00080510 [Aldrovandia affinis]